MEYDEILQEVKDRLVRAKEDLEDSRKAGVNSPGFNQDLGHVDALTSILEYLRGE